MMKSTNSKINKLLVDKILEKIPSDTHPIEYLMKALNLSRKSAYRRKNGELPFSFDEIAILAEALDFSIDELVVRGKDNKALFSHRTDPLSDPKGTFILMLEKSLHFYQQAAKATRYEGVFTLNRVLLNYVVDSTYLFKFFYYMWIHQGNTALPDFRFADLVFPEEIQKLAKQTYEHSRQVHDTTIILDEFVFKNTFDEIAYYRRHGLLTDEEYRLLKEELVSYIKRLESIAGLGKNPYGSKYTIYLSTLRIESNSSYFIVDNLTASSFWVFGTSPISTCSDSMSTSHKRWIDSLKKYSILMSQSNELLQSAFFNEQYRYIDTYESI